METYKKDQQWDLLPLIKKVCPEDKDAQDLILSLEKESRSDKTYLRAASCLIKAEAVQQEYYRIEPGKIVPAGLKPKFDKSFVLKALFFFAVGKYEESAEELEHVEEVAQTAIDMRIGNYTEEFREHIQSEKKRIKDLRVREELRRLGYL